MSPGFLVAIPRPSWAPHKQRATAKAEILLLGDAAFGDERAKGAD